MGEGLPQVPIQRRFRKRFDPPARLGPAPRALVDVGRVANPKPHLTFGFKPEAFTDNEQRINDSQKARLCLNLDHACFVVEVKSGGAPVGDPESQAARAGCAMNSIKRNFNRAAAGARDDQEEATGRESRDQNQAAESSAATEKSQAISTTQSETAAVKPAGYAIDDASTFTTALDPHLAKIFVKWSKKKYSGKSNRPSVFYQMDQIETYNLSKAAEWRDLHSDIYLFEARKGKNKKHIIYLVRESKTSRSRYYILAHSSASRRILRTRRQHAPPSPFNSLTTIFELAIMAPLRGLMDLMTPEIEDTHEALQRGIVIGTYMRDEGGCERCGGDK